jgi:hypothetical protein
MTIASAQGLGVSLGQATAATAHCFPGCKSGDLRVEHINSVLVLAPNVILKRGRKWLNTSTGFIQEREPVEGVSSKSAR